MLKIAEFMIDSGMNADAVSLYDCAAAFCEKARTGLSGKQDELPMIPTYLKAPGRMPQSGTAAVIDAGGTNLRLSSVSFKGGKPCIESLKQLPMPGSEAPIAWEEFISTLAQELRPFADAADAIGFCFSYPAEAGSDLDSRVLGLTKQVKIEGAEGRFPGRDLAAALRTLGCAEKKVVVLNDTPAVLLGGAAMHGTKDCDGYAGLIAGTGLNTCCVLDVSDIPKLPIGSGKMLVNLESGSFSGFARGSIDLAMDEDLPDTGYYVGEKMCSGRYLGMLCMYIMKAAAREGIFSDYASAVIERMTEVTTPTIDKWGRGRFPKGFSAEDKVNLVYIINELFDRAARCAAAELCGIMLLTGQGREKPLNIAADGSLFNKSALFVPELTKHMDIFAGEIMERRYRFVTGENLTLLGTAAAALMN